MRHHEYRLEKQTYKTPEYIMKNDKKYKKTHPLEYRFHLFVKIEIISINDNIAVVNHKEISDLIRNVCKMVSEVSPLICRSKPDDCEYQTIKLQNMDSYFFLNDNRKKKMEKQLQLYQLKTCIPT